MNDGVNAPPVQGRPEGISFDDLATGPQRHLSSGQAETRQRLLDAGARLILSPGEVRLPGLREILTTSGTRKADFYKVFTGRNDYMNALCHFILMHNAPQTLRMIVDHAGDHRSLISNLVLRSIAIVTRSTPAGVRKFDLLLLRQREAEAVWSRHVEMMATAYFDWLRRRGAPAARIRSPAEAAMMVHAGAFMVRSACATRLPEFGSARFVDWIVDVMLALSGDTAALGPRVAMDHPAPSPPPALGPARAATPEDRRRASYLDAGVQLLLDPTTLHPPLDPAVVGRAGGDEDEFARLFAGDYGRQLVMHATRKSLPTFMGVLTSDQMTPIDKIRRITEVYNSMISDWHPAALIKLDMMHLECMGPDGDYFNFTDDLADLALLSLGDVLPAEVSAPDRFDCRMAFRCGAFILRSARMTAPTAFKAEALVDWLAEGLHAMLFRPRPVPPEARPLPA